MKLSIKVISLGLVCTLLAVVLTGAIDVGQAELQEIQDGMCIVEQITDEPVSYEKVITDTNSLYAGMVQYSNQDYAYVVDPEENYVKTVTIKNYYDPNNMISTRSAVISYDEAKTIAENTFMEAMGDFLQYEIETNCQSYAGLGTDYVFEIAEKRDGVETGTKGLVTINKDGTLLGASFLKKQDDPPPATDLISQELIVETAQKAVLAEESNLEILSVQSTELKTTGGSTYWNIKLAVSKGKEQYVALVVVDAVSGDILQMGRSV